MASVLTEFPVRRIGFRKGVSRWDKYLDGQVWRLESGVDFTTKARGVQTSLSIIARKRGVTIMTRLVDGESAIVVQLIAKAEGQ
jgi:hypothetical protein